MELKLLHNTPPWEWPPKAANTIRKALKDRRSTAADRILAAELAGDLIVMDDEMADLLLDILVNANEPELLRARAAVSLGPALEEAFIDGFDDDLSEPSIGKNMFEKVQETLHRTYSDEKTPKEVRRRALEGSVHAQEDWHADAIRTAYSSDDDEWKLTGVFAMRYLPGFEPQILESLKSKNPLIHREAIHAAGDYEVSAAWPHIEALLVSESTPRELLLAAIEAAESVNPIESKPILSELADSEDEEIADAADEALLMAYNEPGEEEDEEEDDDEE
jgi:hypothetical protein